jgi:arabinogalactan oligomer/maltooligosaccharide transport system permease protein
MFLTGDPKSWTLAMTLNGMVGQYASSTPWSQFAAYAILVALPVSAVYLYLQKYIISGLTIGGVKG